MLIFEGCLGNSKLNKSICGLKCVYEQLVTTLQMYHRLILIVNPALQEHLSTQNRKANGVGLE